MQICVSNDAKYFFSSLLNGSNNRLAQWSGGNLAQLLVLMKWDLKKKQQQQASRELAEVQGLNQSEDLVNLSPPILLPYS